MWAVHTHSSQWVYIHRRAHYKQAKARALSCGDRAILFGGVVSVLPESRENAQVNSYQE